MLLRISVGDVLCGGGHGAVLEVAVLLRGELVSRAAGPATPPATPPPSSAKPV